MPLHVGPLTIGDPSQLVWLALPAILLLLYLIRPKPQMREIPSLMFFMKASGRSRLLSFFRMLVHDFMILVQLLILFALALLPSHPSITLNHDITASNTVIVIDGSASMQVEGRFEKAVDEAVDALGSRNTIVIAQERPVLTLRDASGGDAAAFLRTLEPSESTSRIGDSIILAGELLRGKEGRVVVVSDFISTGGVEPEIAKAVLTARGLVVSFINVGSSGHNNIGFVDLVVEDDITTAYIKNYNDVEATVTLTVADQAKPLVIPAKGVEPFVFKTLPQIAELKLAPEDVFMVDNLVRTSAPEEKPVKVALFTNHPSTFLLQALKASLKVDVQVFQPPITPDNDFDVYLVHDVDSKEVLAGTYEKFLGFAQDGKTVIIAAQEESISIDYRGLVPFGLTGTGSNGVIAVDTPTRFTKNIEFGKLITYFTTSLQPGVSSIAGVGNNSIITSATVPGNGKLIWYGILEAGSDFKFSPYYPIFWHELLKYATNQKDIRAMNDKTGNTLLLDHPEDVVTPDGKDNTNRISFQKAGLYRLSDRTIAVNLLSEEESDINTKEFIGEKAGEVKLEAVREKRETDLEKPLLIIALIVLMLELFYVKMRGDV